MNTLLTKSDIAKLPKLYETESLEIEDKMIHAKLFTPWSSWTWYVIEFDGEDQCFGFFKGHNAEFGYFSLSELAKTEGPFGLKVERDKNFIPTEVGDMMSW
jgi:Protein of unknown function (DUF2958)